MKEIKIIGTAYVVTSDLSAKDIELVAKHAPDKLRVKNEDGSKELFAIAFNQGHQNVSPFGVTFGGKTRDEHENATFTGNIPANTEDAKEYVADQLCAVFNFLKQLEETVPQAAREVEAQQTQIAAEREAIRGEILALISVA